MKLFTYWWQNPLERHKIIGKTILKVSGEGCQSANSFDWLGTVTGFQRNFNLGCNDIVIEIKIRNHYYGDSRCNEVKEIFTYPLVNSDIQNVNGVWVLFH